VRNRENEGKNAIFFRGCAKKAVFMRVAVWYSLVRSAWRGILFALILSTRGERRMNPNWNAGEYERLVAAATKGVRRPVAVTFLGAPPDNVARFEH
jgi:hypothetical protein